MSTRCSAVPVAHSGGEIILDDVNSVHLVECWRAFLLFLLIRPLCHTFSFADVDIYVNILGLIFISVDISCIKLETVSETCE